MRILVLIFILCGLLLAQVGTTQQVDGMQQRFKLIEKTKIKHVADIVEKLTKGIDQETEKAAILHRWLIGYLTYDEQFRKGNPSKRNQRIQKVLDHKRAVCQGYANLYAALCQEANIRCEVVYGYARLKPESKLSMEETDHAWNALQLEGQWYLADPTWDSNLLHQQGLNEGPYYQAKPEDFVKTHLPADPMWQLLQHPVPVFIYAQSEQEILKHLQAAKTENVNFDFADSLQLYFQKTATERKLHTASQAYKINPTLSNSKELTAVYLDYEAYLSDRQPQSNHPDSLINYHHQLITLCETASQYSQLFPNQKENCAYNQINFAVALSKRLELAKNRKAELEIIGEMQEYLQQAKEALESLPGNIFITQALQQCEEYLSFCEDW